MLLRSHENNQQDQDDSQKTSEHASRSNQQRLGALPYNTAADEPTQPLSYTHAEAPKTSDKHPRHHWKNSQGSQSDNTPVSEDTGELKPSRSYPIANLTIGSAPDNSVVLDDPLVSGHHARLTLNPDGEYILADLGSTHGTYLNGFHVRRARLMPGAEIRIGPYSFVFTGTELTQYDAGKSIRIDAIDLVQTTRVGLLGMKQKVLLDHISLTILPGTFVAVVGPSGAGKTMLLNALSGQNPAKSGRVLYNGVDYYQHRPSFSTSIGYVPQDDIIHKDLTVERALYYAARIRLAKGLSHEQVRRRIAQVLEDVEMDPQRKQLISRLSGGQRKRVSIAVELLANPALFFLDEPTSGLDPGLDRKMMQLLRRLADRGHTIVLSTHATANIDICDEVCFLATGGRLAYYGPPAQMKQHFERSDYADIYNAIDSDPDQWVAYFDQSRDYLKYVVGPRMQSRSRVASDDVATPQSARAPRPRRTRQFRQFRLLTERYFELMAHDRMNVLILLAQAPIIAILVILLARSNVLPHVSSAADLLRPLDIDAQRTLFILVTSAVWFGTINAAREIVKEAPIYHRERAINLGLAPYVFSKVVVLGLLSAIQSFLLLYIVGTKTGYPSHGLLFSGTVGAFVELYITLLITSFAGLMMGLLISALAPNTDRAVSIVPIILIPQIIFANVIFTLSGIGNVISWIMPARWGMQATGSIARLHNQFSGHDTTFYVAKAANELGYWGVLVLLALVMLGLTLLIQRHKDVGR